MFFQSFNLILCSQILGQGWDTDRVCHENEGGEKEAPKWAQGNYTHYSSTRQVEENSN